jgi:hypothetical protein
LICEMVDWHLPARFEVLPYFPSLVMPKLWSK